MKGPDIRLWRNKRLHVRSAAAAAHHAAQEATNRCGSRRNPCTGHCPVVPVVHKGPPRVQRLALLQAGVHHCYQTVQVGLFEMCQLGCVGGAVADNLASEA